MLPAGPHTDVVSIEGEIPGAVEVDPRVPSEVGAWMLGQRDRRLQAHCGLRSTQGTPSEQDGCQQEDGLAEIGPCLRHQPSTPNR